MTGMEQKRRARKFVERWRAMSCVEEEHSRSFWIELLEDVLSIPNATHVLEFERKVKGRKIDVFYEDMGILIEMKGRGIGLDKASERSKRAGEETPYQQACWYAANLPYSIRPRWIITCNFDEFRIYDQEAGDDSFISFYLDELPDQLHLLAFFGDKRNSRLVREKELSVKAGELVGKLYGQLSRQYHNIDNDAREQRSLNVLVVRLVFLLYAEDSGLLHEKDAVLNYLKRFSADQMRQAIIDLFDVLDTPESERDPYLPDYLLSFPYVNGGLFGGDDVVVPQFTDQIRLDFLLEASQGFDWSGISPTIFGAAFESTLNPATRRAGGMHYTSIENIHKVIDPLFLDALKEELSAIEGEKVERNRKMKLKGFQKKLATINILDPACGSGNFLTESYLSLRKLENRVLEDLQGDQIGMGFGGSDAEKILVSIGQFYGIEVNDFAVSVAKTALWIAEEQMMEATQEILLQPFDFLPLKSNDNIHEGNALLGDWNDVIPSAKCSFIIGNPPFLGAKIMNAEQKKEIVDLFGKKTKLVSSLDYVSGWYVKACSMMKENPSIRSAFVSTNSICQGQQVYPIWNSLKERFGATIDFAHRTFIWNSEASDQAHVHVIIVGFSLADRGGKVIYDADGPHPATHINAYLCDAPDVMVQAAATPICEAAPSCDYGSLINDGGNYIFKPGELETFLGEEPAAERFVRPLMGSEELIKGKRRFVLYLKDATAAEIDSMPKVRERVEAVRAQRAASSAAATRKTAATPQRFYFDSTADEPFLVIPSVSSERRRYVPMAICGPETVATNLVSIVPGATVYHFGILSSRAHNAWMRAVAGRMKSDYRYSPKTVYNTFPWPKPDEEQRVLIEKCAQAVLDARSAYPEATLAELYDPDKMPSELLAAHTELDKSVESAYGVDFDECEETIVAHLFKLYAEKVGE